MASSAIRDTMLKYKRPKNKTLAANYTVIVTNNTDEKITDCFFGVQYSNGAVGGGIIAGFEIAARSTWQHSVAVEGCVVETAGTVYYDSERIIFDPVYATPGSCITATEYEVHYSGKTLIGTLVGGMTVDMP